MNDQIRLKKEIAENEQVNLSTGHYRGNVVIEFSKQIEWFSLAPENARQLAAALISQADKCADFKNLH